MTSWFAQTTNPLPDGFRNKAMWNSHVWGRQMFAGNFARGGIAATIFAPSRTEMLKNIFRRDLKAGSAQHLENVRQIWNTNPGNERVAGAYAKAANAGRKGFHIGGAVGGGVLFAGISAVQAMTETKDPVKRAEIMASAIPSQIGFAAGARVGFGVGAALGSVVPILGTAIGGLVGGVVGGFAGGYAGDEIGRAVTSIPRRLGERERLHRKLNWGNPGAEFSTRQAATMRQLSLQAMSRGMMSARSGLGQEGVFLHQ